MNDRDECARPKAWATPGRPFHPGVTVDVTGDMPDTVVLTARVAAALTRAGVAEADVRLFQDEAAQFTSYENVLAAARHWVTVTSGEDTLTRQQGELPSRALLAERIEAALKIEREAGPLPEDGARAASAMADVLRGHQLAGPLAELREEDLDVSTVRPGARLRGQGGQTVGDFDSYVRVTHRPTGITVERDSERSQLMNKSAALDELRRQLASRQAEPDLREHITRLHPRLHSNGKARSGKTQAQMAYSHAEDHHKMGSTSHHHGPNAGPHARPAGWRDGSGVVLLDDGRAPR